MVDFGEVWRAIQAMTWLELLTLAILAVWNQVTYWFVEVAARPGLNYWQAMKITQTSTAISNSVPGGAALGVGVQTAMYISYGFPKPDIALSMMLTGTWNSFVKLGMPVIALALLAAGGDADGSFLSASLIGVFLLAGVVLLFAVALRSERGALFVGQHLESAASFVMRGLRRTPPKHWGEMLVDFRHRTIHLLRKRWAYLTVATLVSHFTLYLVLLVALRHVGISNEEVSWREVLAAFAFIRLISALPITPGGLGVVELGTTAALVAAGGPAAQVVAAVLVYRVLTFLFPIPLGGLSYLFWRKGAARRRLAGSTG